MRRLHSLFGVTIVGAGLIAIAPLVAPIPGTQIRAVQLISGDTADSPLGDGTALILGGSGLSTPGQAYADVVDSDYLAPRDFTGTTQIVTTPEALYPFLGPFTETFDHSEAQGQQILDTAILNQIAGEMWTPRTRRGFRLLPERGDLVAIDARTCEPKCTQRRCALRAGR